MANCQNELTKSWLLISLLMAEKRFEKAKTRLFYYSRYILLKLLKNYEKLHRPEQLRKPIKVPQPKKTSGKHG